MRLATKLSPLVAASALLSVVVVGPTSVHAVGIGDLDPSFGTGGKATTAFGATTNEQSNAIAIQSDGKVVMVGYTNAGSTQDFAIARYNTNGTLDNTFGAGGKVTTDFDGTNSRNDAAQAVAIQSDGKILVAGYTENGSNTDFAVARYDTNGTLDTTFDTDGKATAGVGTSNDRAYSVMVNPSTGSITLAGTADIAADGGAGDYALVRFTSSGALDTAAFGAGTGKVMAPNGTGDEDGYSAAMQSDGKVIIAGRTASGGNSVTALARYNTNGTLDGTYGTGGVAQVTWGSAAYARAIAIDANGKAVVAGTVGLGSSADVQLARFATNGTLDATFDTDGKVSTSIGSGADQANSVAIQSDGKIVVAGSTYNGSNDDVAVLRYTAVGALDSTFGSGGSTTTAIGSASEFANAVAIQSDGKIVVGGAAGNGSNDDFAILRYAVTAVPAPTVTAVSPTSGTTLGGTFIIITGTNFASGATVTVGGQACTSVNVVSATSITCTTPAGTAGTASVVVTSGGQSNAANTLYSYEAPPSFSTGILDPTFGNKGIVGTSVGIGEDLIYDTAIQSDGKIVAVGSADSLFTVARYNTDGSLDTTFDGDGKSQIRPITNGNGIAQSVEIQSDGKIVVAGSSTNSTINGFAVVRYNSNGSLDTSFGTRGIVVTRFTPCCDQATAMAIQNDGKIVVAGYADNLSHDFGVVRYNTDGSRDTDFGIGGIVTTKLTSGVDEARSIAIQADGKIVVAGYAQVGSYFNFATVRYNSNGSLDTTFDGDGSVLTSVGTTHSAAYSVAIQSDNKIVLTGWVDMPAPSNSKDFATVRYNANGSLDTSFDLDGKVTTSFGTGDDAASALAIQSDGKIVAAGKATAISNDFGVARFNSDGSLDNTFDLDGIVTTAVSSKGDLAFSVNVQGDGKLIAAGAYTNTAGNSDFALVRYGIQPPPGSRASQTISVSGAPVSVKIGAAPFSISAIANSGLPVALTSSTPTLCTVSGDSVTIVSTLPGTCKIVASQGGDSSVLPATDVTTYIEISKADQAVLKYTGETKVQWLPSDKKIAIASTGGSGTGEVTARVTSAGTAQCTATATHIVAAYPGTCFVGVAKAADGTYNAATSVAVEVTFSSVSQAVSVVSKLPAQPQAGDTFDLELASDSPYAPSAPIVAVDVASRTICSISSGTSPTKVTLLQRGSCVLLSWGPGTVGLLRSPIRWVVVAAGLRTQTINFAEPTDMTFGQPDRETVATATSQLGVLFESLTTDVCTVKSTGYVTVKSVGTCTISASQSGNNVYSAAPTVERTFQVLPATPTTPFVTSASAGDTSALVAFTKPGFDGGAPVTSYVLVATPIGGGTTVTFDNCMTSPCTVSGLTNGTTYTFTVAAKNLAGVGKASAPSPKVTPAGRPDAVRNLAALIDGTTLSATWTSPTSLNGGLFDRYDISARATGSSWPAQPTTQVTTADTKTASITGIAAKTAYDLKVVTITAMNSLEMESNTAEVSVAPRTTPDAPSQPTALDASSREVVVSWTEPPSDGGSPVKSYVVTLQDGTPCPRVEFDAATRVGRCIISNPKLGTTYTISVSAVNDEGTGKPVVVELTAPKSPTADTLLAEPEESVLPPIPGNVRITPVAAKGDNPEQTRLSITLPTGSSATTVVFVVSDPKTGRSVEYAVNVRKGATTVSVVIPKLASNAVVSAYSRNKYGVSRNAPTNANISASAATSSKGTASGSTTLRKLGPELRFDAASIIIKKGYRPFLKKVASTYGATNVTIHVTGYARGGGAPKNVLSYLSTQRALAVARFLSRSGAKVKIIYAGRGDNGKNPGYAVDRRVTIAIEETAKTANK